MSDERKNKVGKIVIKPIENIWYELSADPINWLSKAEELKRSALILADVFFQDMDMVRKYSSEYQTKESSDVVLPKGDTMSQFMLLAGFALENVFKAYVIYKNPNLVSNGRIEGILKDHNLVKLAHHADIELNPEEERFCELAFNATISFGRYPIPKEARYSMSSSKITGHAVFTFESLFERLLGLRSERFNSRTKYFRS